MVSPPAPPPPTGKDWQKTSKTFCFDNNCLCEYRFRNLGFWKFQVSFCTQEVSPSCYASTFLCVFEIRKTEYKSSAAFHPLKQMSQEAWYSYNQWRSQGGRGWPPPWQKLCPPSPTKWNCTLYRGLWRASIFSPSQPPCSPLSPPCRPLILKSLATPLHITCALCVLGEFVIWGAKLVPFLPMVNMNLIFWHIGNQNQNTAASFFS